MEFPDISSIIRALREQPYEFYMSNGCLERRRSTYRFKLSPFGLAVVQVGNSGPRCLIAGDEVQELIAAFQEWRRDCWVPAEVNRAFSRQLRPLGLWRRLWYLLESRLPERREESALAIYGRAFLRDLPLARDSGPEPPPKGPSAPRPPLPVRQGAAGAGYLLRLES